MSYVNLSNNKISGVVDIIEVFCHLKQVQRLDIEKNPVLLSSKKELHDQLVKQTSVKILNRTNILPLTENVRWIYKYIYIYQQIFFYYIIVFKELYSICRHTYIAYVYGVFIL